MMMAIPLVSTYWVPDTFPGIINWLHTISMQNRHNYIQFSVSKLGMTEWFPVLTDLLGNKTFKPSIGEVHRRDFPPSFYII